MQTRRRLKRDVKQKEEDAEQARKARDEAERDYQKLLLRKTIDDALIPEKPEFKGGTADVDGVEKAVAINEAVPAKFDDGTTSKKVEGVGTYTVAPDGSVTFVQRNHSSEQEQV